MKSSKSRADSAADSWQELFWTVFELSTNAIALFDEARVNVKVNPAMCKLVGRPPEEIVGRRLDELMTPETRRTLAAEWRDLWRCGHWSRERDLVRSDGSVAHVQVGARVSEVDGRRLGVAVMLEMPFDKEKGRREGPLGQLTPREREVLRLVALGYTSPQIAEELVISTATVRTHVRNAMAKTGARTRAQLVATALADRHIHAGD